MWGYTVSLPKNILMGLWLITAPLCSIWRRTSLLQPGTQSAKYTYIRFVLYGKAAILVNYAAENVAFRRCIFLPWEANTTHTEIALTGGYSYMKATGIVRRIDDLGRVVIPKEIRRTMRIREGDPLQTALTRWERFCFAMDDLAKRNGWK